jgi:hypothetical protein
MLGLSAALLLYAVQLAQEPRTRVERLQGERLAIPGESWETILSVHRLDTDAGQGWPML